MNWEATPGVEVTATPDCTYVHACILAAKKFFPYKKNWGQYYQ